MRTSKRNLSVLLVALACALLTEVASAPSAEACSPQGQPRPSAAPAVSFAAPSAALPKDAGIVFVVYQGELKESEVLAKLTIEVREGATAIEGTLQPLGVAIGSPYRSWHWKPKAPELPVGALSVHIEGGDGKSTDTPITIADRRLVVPTLAVTSLTATRALIRAPGASDILCEAPASIGSCNSSGTAGINTRQVGVPQLSEQHEPLPEADSSYLRQAISFYGRNEDGSIGGSDLHAGSSQLERAYAQYCVEVTAASILDGTEVKTEKCIPHGSLDLAVSEAEDQARVKAALSACTSVVYPQGTSKEDFTGESSGCSVSHGPMRGGSFGACAVGLGLALATLRGRRRASATPPPRNR